MKKLFFFSIAVTAFNLNSQSLYIKSETVTYGLPSFVASMSNAKEESFYSDDRYKTIVVTKSATQTNIVTMNGATVINKIGKKTDCAKFTREEMNNDSLETDLNVSNVRVQYSDERKTILGYECKKVIISYSMVQIVTVEGEMIFWVTEEIKKPQSKQMPQLNKRNALFDAIAELKGYPLETEAVMKGNNVRTVTTVTEFKTTKIPDSVFEVGADECKSPLNLKEYKALVAKRKRQANMSGF